MTACADASRDDARHSDLPIPPGEYLAEVLVERAWDGHELARRIGAAPGEIDAIIRGEMALGDDFALRLERALGVPAVVWVGLEREYRRTSARVAARAVQPGSVEE